MSRAAFLTSLRSKLALLLVPILLSGCGFQPLYAKGGAEGQEALRMGIAVDSIDGRIGQLLTIELEDQLNPGGQVPPNPVYRLTPTLILREAGIGVARDGTVSRYNVYLDAGYTLTRIRDNQRMTSGYLRHVSSYNNIINQYYSTYVAQQDAYKRGVTELAQLFRQRLGAYLTQNNGNPPIEEIEPGKLLPLPVPETPNSQNSLTPPINPYQ